MNPQGNTNWYSQGQQQGGGLLGQIGQQLPNLASLGAVALAPELSLPAMAVRGALGGLGGSLVGNAMGAHTNPVTSALGGLESGGQLGYLKNLTGSAVDPALRPILDSLGNNTSKIAKSGLTESVDLLKQLGIKASPEAMQQTAEDANNYFNAQINQALQAGGPISLNEPLRAYTTLAETGTPPKSGAQALIQQALQRNGIIGSADADMVDPQVARKIIQDIGAEAGDIKSGFGFGPIDPAVKRDYNELMDAYNTLKGHVYDRPEVNSYFENANLLPEHLALETSNPKLAEYMAGVMNKAGTGGQPAYQDILDEMSSFTKMGQLGKNGLQVKNNVYPVKPPSQQNPFSNAGVLGALSLGMLGNRGNIGE